MVTVNDFKFDLRQRVVDRFGQVGIVMSQRRRGSGNDYEVDYAPASSWVPEECLSAAVDYPCPGGIASIILVLDTGMVMGDSNYSPPLGSPYHIYRWDSRKGMYMLDTACSCMRKSEMEGRK